MMATDRWDAAWLREPRFGADERRWRDESLANPRLVHRGVAVSEDCWRRGMPERWDRSGAEMGVLYLFQALKTLAQAVERIEAKLDAIERRLDAEAG
jgi:hypothetical protein